MLFLLYRKCLLVSPVEVLTEPELRASSRIALSDSISGLSKGMKLSSDAALGHVRLEVVGGTYGQQPFRSCDGRFTSNTTERYIIIKSSEIGYVQNTTLLLTRIAKS